MPFGREGMTGDPGHGVGRERPALFQEEAEPALGGTNPGSQPRLELATSRTWHGLHNAVRACVDLLDAYWQAYPAEVSFSDPKAEGLREGGAYEEYPALLSQSGAGFARPRT